MIRLLFTLGLLLPANALAEPTNAWFTTQIEAGRSMPVGRLGAPRLTQTLGWYLNADRSGSTVGLRLLGENNGGLGTVGGGGWYGYALRLGAFVIAPTVGASYLRIWSTEPRVVGGLNAAEGYAAVDVRVELGRLILNVRPAAMRGSVSRAGTDARFEAGLGVGLAF